MILACDAWSRNIANSERERGIETGAGAEVMAEGRHDISEKRKRAVQLFFKQTLGLVRRIGSCNDRGHDRDRQYC